MEYKQIDAQIYNYRFWITCTNPKTLKNKYDALLKKIGFTILQFHEHYFPEKGYTCFWLLGESHLAIHTFPENKKTYIELSSCNKEKLTLFKTESSLL
ncbi:S-adenosylmethionine decarboxylase [Polaribacter litorisediminis]|uniref:S-adenosylmethionine decarboxylase n=1 Tax=Polaribacter litorisediminis TaxID=1908341 RepID=UPI001CC1BC24|nr:S-adenosylmethionine decarboxylase [Polaribacter litorisediminis]UAM98291.1 S-adenosylmethionine decarboxylase [Polaribacter litorisediminis]